MKASGLMAIDGQIWDVPLTAQRVLNFDSHGVRLDSGFIAASKRRSPQAQT
jgi:hypothetical protein